MAVTVVSFEEFMNEIKAHEKVVVKLFTDWCGSCRIFRPKFIRMSEDDRFTGIRFLDINTGLNLEIKKMLTLTHYPSFAIFRNGQHVETLATTKEDQVAEFIRKLLGAYEGK